MLVVLLGSFISPWLRDAYWGLGFGFGFRVLGSRVFMALRLVREFRVLGFGWCHRETLYFALRIAVDELLPR